MSISQVYIVHELARHVRFSVNPFLEGESWGWNSFASKPAGEGLAFFFDFCVELSGEPEASTGFVVNVTEIDRQVRESVVPVFGERLRKEFRGGRHIGLSQISELLWSSWVKLEGQFGSAKINRLSLSLNPFRNVAVDCRDFEMVYFSEKFEFAATHKLWNDDFSAERNFEVFGKCANPAGHGHNYVLEVTVEVPAEADVFSVGVFEKAVNDELIELLDHKNLNAEVAPFEKTNPTIENIAVFAWERVAGKFGAAKLHCITVRETDRTYCSYYGPVESGD